MKWKLYIKIEICIKFSSGSILRIQLNCNIVHLPIHFKIVISLGHWLK